MHDLAESKDNHPPHATPHTTTRATQLLLARAARDIEELNDGIAACDCESRAIRREGERVDALADSRHTIQLLRGADKRESGR